MKTSLILLLCFLSLAAPALCAQREELPPDVTLILDTKYPGWRFSQVNDDVRQFFKERFPNAYPNLVKGDFDGNGKTDYAVLIEHTNFDKTGKSFTHVVETLAFLRKGDGYRLYVLEESKPADLELYLNLARRGEEGSDFQTEKKYRYANDSISVSYFEKAGGTYIYDRGKFRYVLESD
jgi:hypothetical protein